MTKFEIAKLAVSALTPLIVAGFGWRISTTLKHLEQKQWSNRKLIEKRIEIYDKISPLMNRLFCYFYWVGDWKEHSPIDIIKTKRSLDHTVHIYRHLLEPEFFEDYMRFMDALFVTYNGAGEDARLRTAIRNQDGDRTKLKSWQEDFAACFDPSSALPLGEIDRLYETVMQIQRRGIFS